MYLQESTIETLMKMKFKADWEDLELLGTLPTIAGKLYVLLQWAVMVLQRLDSISISATLVQSFSISIHISVIAALFSCWCRPKLISKVKYNPDLVSMFDLLNTSKQCSNYVFYTFPET